VLVVAVAAVTLIATSGSGGSSHAAPTAHRVAVQRQKPPAAHGTRARAELAAVSRLARKGLPLFCGGREKRMVALTFDDGPGPYTTLAIRKLRQAHLRATFFLVGKSIRAYPDLARLEKPVADVGDHTMTHPFLPELSQSEMAYQIADARSLIE